MQGIIDTCSIQQGHRTAVLIPCYNEGKSIGTVISDFQAVLPNAVIYVYDNNSSDDTIQVAIEHGALVRREPLQGKGSVVRRMFADVDADVYVLVDGDATYHAPSAPGMIERLVTENLDMVTGNRVSDQKEAYRRGHRFGNLVLTGIVASVFGRQITDMLSGYRVLSRRFVKSFPSMSRGFETETELTVHALELRMPLAEVDTPYGARPPGSHSKLSTYRDGIRILRMIVRLVKDERPLAFFGIVSGLLFLGAIALAMPVILTWLETGLVPRLPTAILSTGVTLLSFLTLSCGIVLDSVALGRREARRFAYLTGAAPLAQRESISSDRYAPVHQHR